jgi:hypothetical protein
MNVLLKETPLGQLEILEVFLQYDGPRLFSCLNKAKHIYLALWVDDENDIDLWMYVPISNQKLLQVRSGDISLREAFTESETGYLHIAKVAFSGEVQDFKLVKATEVNEEWLPLQNVRLNISSAIISPQSARSISESMAREVLNVALRFPNYNLHEVPSQKLGYFLSNLQGLVDAIGQVILGMPTALGKVPEAITNKTRLNVIGSFAGSFGIRLATSGMDEGELFSTSSLLAPDVIEKLLDLLHASKDEIVLLDSLRKLSLRTVASYRKVLRSLVSAEAGLSVEWGSLIIGKGGHIELTYEQVNTALATASNVEVREKNNIRIVGKLIQGNEESGHFLFKILEDEKKIAGFAQDPSILNKEVLGGIYIGVFEETIEVTPSGDVMPTYKLFELIPSS